MIILKLINVSMLRKTYQYINWSSFNEKSMLKQQTWKHTWTSKENRVQWGDMSFLSMMTSHTCNFGEGGWVKDEDVVLVMREGWICWVLEKR